METASRNDSWGFADRTKRNLLFIEEAYKNGREVHVVTQIVTSTLGLLVFPWEHQADIRIRGTLLSTLDWPKWKETKPSKGLGELIRKLRNAIAHGNLQFSSDDRNADNVVVTFRSDSGDWQASMFAHDLRNFCLRFIELIQGVVG